MKKIIPFMVLLCIPLTACGNNTQEKQSADFIGESYIVDGEVISRPLNASDSNTISVKKGDSFSLTNVLSAIYGDDIDISNIRCTKGVGEVNGDTVKVHSDIELEFSLTIEDITNTKKMYVVIE